MPHLAVLMMIKNEEKRIHVTLQSIREIADSIVIYDTGSTDTTLSIIKQTCQSWNIPLHLKIGTFIDFATSRNVALAFADTLDEIDFLLLLDCNDELRGAGALREWIDGHPPPEISAWYIVQHWFWGQHIEYTNVRLIRPQRGWRYKGPVHEYLYQDMDIYKNTHIEHILKDHQHQQTPHSELVKQIIAITHQYEEHQQNLGHIGPTIPGIQLYQDRTLDDDKSGKRFIRDYDILMNEYKQYPDDVRTVFYLAQTCECLGKYEEAYTYYKLRSTMGGFHEEVYESCVRLGMITLHHLLPWIDESHRWPHAFYWNTRAYECEHRVEPLIPIIEHYIKQHQWHVAYMYAHQACRIPYPRGNVLVIQEEQYKYTRYHLMGIIAFYVQEYQEGMDACMKALAAKSTDIDQYNQQFYEHAIQAQTHPS